MTEDVHTIQDLKSGLFIPLSFQGTFSVFNLSKPTEDDIRVGEPVLSPLKGAFGIRIARRLQMTKHPFLITGEKC